MASGGWQGSTRRVRLPKDWHARRARVLRRDKGICHVCHQPGADAVDHVRQGDAHDEANLAAIHDRVPPHCHRAKSSREGGAAAGQARRARAATRKRPAEPHPGLVPQPAAQERPAAPGGRTR